jgi:putative hemolysin
MNSSLFQLLILLLLILVNGSLAMAEIAVVSSRRVRLQQRAKEGNTGAETALELLKQPTSFLSTVQIGITLVGILAGAFGEATLARKLVATLEEIPSLAPYAEAIGVVVVVVSLTYLSLVLGELAPKQIALTNPERIAAALAPPLEWLARITAPIVRLLSLSTRAVLKVLRVPRPAGQELTEEEIQSLIEQGIHRGVFEPVEGEMVKQIFRLNDRRIESLMTPRSEVNWLDLDKPTEEIKSTILENRHTIFPVARGDLDQLAGVVFTKDLLARCFSNHEFALEPVLRKPVIVPESTPAFEVLNRFREQRTRIAMVIDEFGGILGLVTTTDLLERIVGDLPEAGEEIDPDIVLRSDGSWLLDGMVPIDEFKELVSLESLPGEEKNYYQTLGGFVITQLGQIPSSGDLFEWEGIRLEVVDMDGRRVDKILVTPPSPQVESDES